NFVNYANQSQADVTSLFNKFVSYYDRLQYFKKKTQRPSFTCGDQLDEYFFKQAMSATGLANSGTLTGKAQSVQEAAENLDRTCKALDTYHKLEDYLRDDFKQADVLINEFQSKLQVYRAAHNALRVEIENTAAKLSPAGAYASADAALRKEINREKA